MFSVLIAAGSEAAARALAAGVFGAALVNLSSGRLSVSFLTNANGVIAWPAAQTLYNSLVSSGYVAIPTAGTTSAVYQLSTTTPNGGNDLFFFPSKVGWLIGMYLGGVIQLPADCTVTVDGGVQLASYVPKPTLPVTALFIPAAS